MLAGLLHVPMLLAVVSALTSLHASPALAAASQTLAKGSPYK